MAATAYRFSPPNTSFPSSRTTPQPILYSLPSSFFTPKNNPTSKFCWLRISHKKAAQIVKAFPEPEFPVSSDSQEDAASIDIKLPRRSLMVQFTCDACGERTRRLVNQLAYERGTVFVQCAGCLQHHKLVDNLGLIVEYDFREDISVDSNKDQE